MNDYIPANLILLVSKVNLKMKLILILNLMYENKNKKTFGIKIQHFSILTSLLLHKLNKVNFKNFFCCCFY